MKRRNFLQLGTLATSALVLDSCGRMSDIVLPQQILNNPFQIVVKPELLELYQSKELIGSSKLVIPTDLSSAKLLSQSGELCDCEESFLKTKSEFLQFLKKENLYQSAPSELLSIVDYIEANRGKIMKGLVIDVDVFDNPIVQQNSPNARMSGWSYGQWVGNYRLRFDYHYGYVSGCIRRNTNHVNLAINTRDGRQLINIHIAGWKRNSYDYCFGVYESTRGRSWCSCPKDYYVAVRDYVLAALLAIGLAYAVAWAIAQVAAVISVGILAV